MDTLNKSLPECGGRWQGLVRGEVFQLGAGGERVFFFSVLTIRHGWKRIRPISTNWMRQLRHFLTELV